MKIAIILSILLTVLHLVFGIAKAQKKLKKEREFFGGYTKRAFREQFTKDWKLKYFDAMRRYLNLENGSASETWKTNILNKSVKNDIEYKEQLEGEISYLWVNFAKNTALFNDEKTDIKDLEKWRLNWIRNELNRLDVSETKEVINELTKIGRKVN